MCLGKLFFMIRSFLSLFHKFQLLSLQCFLLMHSHTMHSPPTSNDTLSSSPHTSYPHMPRINQRVSITVSKVPSYLSNNVCSMPNVKPSQNAETNQNNSYFSLNALISQSNHIISDVLNPDSQQVMRSICHDMEPFSYEEAASNPAWK